MCIRDRREVCGNHAVVSHAAVVTHFVQQQDVGAAQRLHDKRRLPGEGAGLRAAAEIAHVERGN